MSAKHELSSDLSDDYSLLDPMAAKIFQELIKKGIPVAWTLSVTFDVKYEGPGLQVAAHADSLLASVRKFMFGPNNVTPGQVRQGSIIFEHCQAQLSDFISFLYSVQEPSILKKVAKDVTLPSLQVTLRNVVFPHPFSR